MISIRIADFLNSIAQLYITYHFICKLWKPKYNYAISNLISCLWIILTYIKVACFVANDSVMVRVFGGMIIMVLFAVIILDGTIIQNIVRGILYYVLFVILEGFTLAILNTWFSLDYNKIIFNTNLVLGRVIFTLIAYLFIIILELVINRNKSKDLRWAAILSAILVVCELIFFLALIYTMWEKEGEYLAVICSFSTVLVMIGYYITTEMFYEMIRQQEKKNELEQKLLEKQYQYDYYILAKEQAEKARDLRHDMRNQLQTVQHLIQMEGEKERAQIMIEKLRERIEKLIL